MAALNLNTYNWVVSTRRNQALGGTPQAGNCPEKPQKSSSRVERTSQFFVFVVKKKQSAHENILRQTGPGPLYEPWKISNTTWKISNFWASIWDAWSGFGQWGSLGGNEPGSGPIWTKLWNNRAKFKRFRKLKKVQFFHVMIIFIAQKFMAPAKIEISGYFSLT